MKALTCQIGQVALFVLALTGCATMQPQCEPAQIVEKAVAIGCLGDTPDEPVDQVGVGDYPGDRAAAQAALIDAAAWKGYAVKLKAAQAGCDKKTGMSLFPPAAAPSAR
jgi:hypothetical protein